MGGLCDRIQSEVQPNVGENVQIIKGNSSYIKNSYYKHNESTVESEKPIAILFGYGSSRQPQSPAIEISEFKLIKVLGRGSFGKVLLVQRNDQLYAMKILRKDEIEQRKQKRNTQYERLILAISNSNFVVKLHFAFQTKYKLYLVIDFQQGGELFFHLRKSSKFTEAKARFYGAELLLALEHLHSQNIIYRDLKPENILIGSDGHIKITDFGLSKCGVSKDDKSYSFVGTPEYLAPEILIGQGHNYVCDFWSLGALIFEMLSGAPPYYCRDKAIMFRNRLEKPIDMRKQQFSEPTSSLLQGLLCNDPRYRLGAGGHDEIKSHEFFKDIDWAQLILLKNEPPFIPILENEQDLRYFDPIFTSEPPRDSPINERQNTLDNYAHFSFERCASAIVGPKEQEQFELV